MISKYLNESRERVDWIDLAKGLAIFIVIFGHTIPTSGAISRGIIFSFHMPLFFILSCVTFRFSATIAEFAKKTARAFRHLIIPAIVVFFLTTFITFIIHSKSYDSVDKILPFIRDRLMTICFSSGINVPLGDYTVSALGIPWFFVVLFCGRTLFDFINLKCNHVAGIIICVSLSVIGTYLGMIQALPLSVDITLAIMPLFLVGKYFGIIKIQEKPLVKMIISLLIWAGMFIVTGIFTNTYMELACRRYPLYPVCFIEAIAGSLFFCELSVLLCRFKRVLRPLLYIGKNSLYLLCVHSMDTILIDKLWRISDNIYINFLMRTLINLALFVVLMGILKLLKKLSRTIHKKKE